MAPLTGPAAESGLRQVNGAKQAAEAIDAAGGVLAFSRLAAHGDLAGFLASNRHVEFTD